MPESTRLRDLDYVYETLALFTLCRRGCACRIDPQGGRRAACDRLGGKPPDHGPGGGTWRAAVRAASARRAADGGGRVVRALHPRADRRRRTYEIANRGPERSAPRHGAHRMQPG